MKQGNSEIGKEGLTDGLDPTQANIQGSGNRRKLLFTHFCRKIDSTPLFPVSKDQDKNFAF